MITIATHITTWSVMLGLYTAGVVSLFYLGASPVIVGWLLVLVRQGRIETGATQKQIIIQRVETTPEFAFNGLTGSDLVVFNALKKQNLPGPVPNSRLEFLTGYTTRTLCDVTARLIEYGMISRKRDRPGTPYIYNIEDDYALPHS